MGLGKDKRKNGKVIGDWWKVAASGFMKRQMADDKLFRRRADHGHKSLITNHASLFALFRGIWTFHVSPVTFHFLPFAFAARG